jgi:hypothetical protein
LDIFEVHEGVIGQYRSYVQSFLSLAEILLALKKYAHKECGQYRTWCMALEAWDAQQQTIASGELSWEHPRPGPSLVGSNAQQAPACSAGQAVSVEGRPTAGIPEAETKPPARPKAKKQEAAKATERPGRSSAQLPHLPDLSLASEGAFSQRLKRVQKLSVNPSPADIAELTVYLTAPESGLRWLAGATLSKTGGPRVEAALKALLEQDINDEVREEAVELLAGLSSN